MDRRVYRNPAAPKSPSATSGVSLSGGPSQPADESAATRAHRESDLQRGQLPGIPVTEALKMLRALGRGSDARGAELRPLQSAN
jgi:hypothetical protein